MSENMYMIKKILSDESIILYKMNEISIEEV